MRISRSEFQHPVLAVCGFALLISGIVVTADRALADQARAAQEDARGMLRVTVDDDYPLYRTLNPGEAMDWLIASELEGAPVGDFTIELRAAGAFVTDAAMTVRVASCDEPFDVEGSEPTCADESLIVPTTRLSDVATKSGGDQFVLRDLHAGEARHINARFALPAGAGTEPGSSAELGLGLHVSGGSDNQVTVPSRAADPYLPRTGSWFLGPALFGIGLVVTGWSVRRVARPVMS